MTEGIKDNTRAAPIRPLAATEKHGRTPSTLQHAIPTHFPSPLPRHLRVLAWVLAFVVPSLFYVGPLMLVLPPFLYLAWPRAALLLLVADVILVLYPARPWPSLRRLFQLWYEPFNVRHNLAEPVRLHPTAETSLHILAMHPHGIIPIQALLWVAFCDQFMPQCYGFGAAADAAMRVPLLRQLLGWLSSGSASRDELRGGLDSGQNLFILPGGVAEVFTSHPGRHVIKARRPGLMKLALQTGAALVPVYVFGGNDFYHHLATFGTETPGVEGGDRGESPQRRRQQYGRSGSNIVGVVQEKISRSLKAGLTIFWGQYGLPIPYKVQCTMVLGDPIWPNTIGEDETEAGKKLTCRKVLEPTHKQIDELLGRYIDGLTRLFDQYKVQAGCPNAELFVE